MCTAVFGFLKPENEWKRSTPAVDEKPETNALSLWPETLTGSLKEVFLATTLLETLNLPKYWEIAWVPSEVWNFYCKAEECMGGCYADRLIVKLTHKISNQCESA